MPKKNCYLFLKKGDFLRSKYPSKLPPPYKNVAELFSMIVPPLSYMQIVDVIFYELTKLENFCDFHRIQGSQLRSTNLIQNSNCSFSLFGMAGVRDRDAHGREDGDSKVEQETTNLGLLKDITQMFKESFEDHDDLVLKYSVLSGLR